MRGIPTIVNNFIYLASQSPRRSQLLGQLGVRHELLLPGEDEDSEGLELALKNEAPQAYVQRVTGLKLDAALRRLKARGLPSAPTWTGASLRNPNKNRENNPRRRSPSLPG